jgi:hypothetical protein
LIAVTQPTSLRRWGGRSILSCGRRGCAVLTIPTSGGGGA